MDSADQPGTIRELLARLERVDDSALSSDDIRSVRAELRRIRANIEAMLGFLERLAEVAPGSDPIQESIEAARRECLKMNLLVTKPYITSFLRYPHSLLVAYTSLVTGQYERVGNSVKNLVAVLGPLGLSAS